MIKDRGQEAASYVHPWLAAVSHAFRNADGAPVRLVPNYDGGLNLHLTFLHRPHFVGSGVPVFWIGLIAIPIAGGCRPSLTNWEPISCRTLVLSRERSSSR
jgi:hypothetical protein